MWLTERIAFIHRESRKTYGVRRVHAELTLGHGIVCERRQPSVNALAQDRQYATQRLGCTP